MSPDFRKVALIAGSLGLLLSLVVALRPNDREEPEATTEHSVTAAPAPPDVVTIQIVVGNDGVTSVRRHSVEQGRNVALFVRSELADRVHLHGYDLIADVAPGAPALIELTAEFPGRFEIELEDSALQIAELEVRA